MKYGIVGAGLIGKKRAAAIRQAGGEVVAIYDVATGRAEELAATYGAKAVESLDELIRTTGLGAAVIATTNGAVLESAKTLLTAGIHLLIEKPAGRHPADLHELANRATLSGATVRIGFNHRFHPGLQKARELLLSGVIGDLMYLRARYGHGGRRGYDREWRANPELGGGGELLDQGVHLIDLSRWLGGELELEFGRVHTYFWDMPVEDNGFLLLRAPNSAIRAHLHASCTEWKNTFDFEIFGKRGKLQIFGLGGSYGVEELRIYKRPPEGGVPDTEILTYPGEDLSWLKEMQAFEAEIEGKTTDIATVHDAQRAVGIVHEAYRASTTSFAKP